MARRDIIVIGASAGGIEVLGTILSALPWNFEASLFVVVHTSEESPGLLAEILNRSSKLAVLYAVHNAPVLPARVYVAPPGARHRLLERGRIRLLPGPRETRSRPAIDALFRSASQAYGSQVIGVVLTGNLDDGATGLADIKTVAASPLCKIPTRPWRLPCPRALLPPLMWTRFWRRGHWPEVSRIGSNGNGRRTAATEQWRERHGFRTDLFLPGVWRSSEGNSGRWHRAIPLPCHIYSPESLLADQGIAVAKALWAAIRILEEQAEFADKLAGKSRRNQQPRLFKRFNEKAVASRENASVLRDLLHQAADRVFEADEQSTATDSYREKSELTYIHHRKGAESLGHGHS